MKINNDGLNLIKKYEGCILHTYKCPAGVATIGYGHTGKVNGKPLNLQIPITITKAKAESLLKSDLKTYEKAVEKINKKYKYNFSKNQFSALVSFAYNLGIGSLEQVTKNGTRTKNEIAESMLLYNKANGKVLTGLVARRKAEVNLFLKDIDKIAKEVISGNWSTGEERKKMLEKAGYNYKEIQTRVNEMVKGE